MATLRLGNQRLDGVFLLVALRDDEDSERRRGSAREVMVEQSENLAQNHSLLGVFDPVDKNEVVEHSTQGAGFLEGRAQRHVPLDVPPERDRIGAHVASFDRHVRHAPRSGEALNLCDFSRIEHAVGGGDPVHDGHDKLGPPR